ncbi:MAG TPA: MBL fold metallo-hydrolase [Chitinophagaceae bacterium]|jgi:glyoxylase-like metal-dependent hydrolase (beta-lactamase superfamily II)|nr:MBL fold metallo-hydrolase [Chitinophagaceae bacterium]
MFSIASFTFSPIAENTYLLHNETGDCIIIDPGCYFGNERETLQDYIEKHALRPKYLLNTHCHLDHVFGNKFVHDTWQLELYIHPKEQPVLAFAAEAGVQWGMPFSNYEGPLHFLREGEQIRLGNDVLNVLFAPGHSPGHICFYCAAQNFVIDGDVLFRQSIGRTDLPGGNHETLLNSIRNVLFTLPDDTVLYPGHGATTTVGFEKKHNPFLRMP